MIKQAAIENIEELNKKIKELKDQEKTYLLKNSKYIFQYFEEKKNISGNNQSNVIHSFFTSKSNNELPSNKKKYENYWKNVNNEILSIQDYIYPIDSCNCCNNGELILQEEEGVLICNNPKCGIMITHIIESSKPSNKEPPNEVSYTAYIRLNHFKEILSQFQAKETTQIPPDVIDLIRARIKKERIDPRLEILSKEKKKEVKSLTHNFENEFDKIALPKKAFTDDLKLKSKYAKKLYDENILQKKNNYDVFILAKSSTIKIIRIIKKIKKYKNIYLLSDFL